MISGAIGKIVALIGLPGLIVLGLLGFYEGVPVVNRIPLHQYVPGIGDLAVGRVQRRYFAGVDDGKRIERAKWVDAAKEQQVKWKLQRQATEKVIDEVARQSIAHQMQISADLTGFQTLLTTESTNADFLCSGPVISERVSARLDKVGRWQRP